MSLPSSFTSTYDFRLLSNIKPFWEALNRRYLALGSPSFGVPAIGDDCSGAGCTYTPPGAVARSIFNIDSLQGAVVGMAGAFIDSGLIGSLTGYTVTYTSGGGAILPLMNWTTSGGDADEATNGPNILKRIGCTKDRNGNYNLTRKRPARITGLTQLDPTDGVTVIAGLYDDGLLNVANDTPVIGAIAYYDPGKVSVNYPGYGFWPTYPDQNAGCRYILTMVAGVKTWVKATDQRVKPTELTGWGVAVAGDYLGPWIWQQLAAIFPLCKDQKASAGYGIVTDMSGASYVNDIGTPQPDGRVYGTGDQDNIVPNAKAAAIADYNAGGVSTGGAWVIGGTAVSFPAAESQYSVHYVGSDNTIPGDGYSSGGAGLARVTAKFTVSGQNAVMTSNRTIEWFYWIDGKTTTFDGLPFGKLGDTIPDQSKLTSFETASPGMAAITETTNIFPASTTYPGWPTTRNYYYDYTLVAGNISTPHYLAEYGNSWRIGGNFAIVRWSFSD